MPDELSWLGRLHPGDWVIVCEGHDPAQHRICPVRRVTKLHVIVQDGGRERKYSLRHGQEAGDKPYAYCIREATPDAVDRVRHARAVESVERLHHQVGRCLGTAIPADVLERLRDGLQAVLDWRADRDQEAARKAEGL